jgi:hypothetical protein
MSLAVDRKYVCSLYMRITASLAYLYVLRTKLQPAERILELGSPSVKYLMQSVIIINVT